MESFRDASKLGSILSHVPSAFVCSSVPNSVANGPPPTLVMYALKIPIIVFMFVGPIPKPVHAPPAVGFEDVT